MSKAKPTAAATQSTASAPSTTPTPSALTESRILRRPEVEALTGLCTSSLYNGMRKGTFPQSVPLGSRAVGWRAKDIAAFLEHGVAGVKNGDE